MTQLQLQLLIWLLGAGILVQGANSLIHYLFLRAESKVTKLLPQDKAQAAVHLLQVVDSITEGCVQEANQVIVNGLKSRGLFDERMAVDIKSAVTQRVLGRLGDLQMDVTSIFGKDEIYAIVQSLIEKHVAYSKDLP